MNEQLMAKGDSVPHYPQPRWTLTETRLSRSGMDVYCPVNSNPWHLQMLGTGVPSLHPIPMWDTGRSGVLGQK